MKNILLYINIFCFVTFNVFAAEKLKNEDEKTLKMLELFSSVLERIEKSHVDKPDKVKLIEAAINGMLTSTDPHSAYIDEKSYKEMMKETKGQFGGVGMMVTMDRGLVKVISPIDDTPAYKNGIKAGDYIISIDDKQVVGMSLIEAVHKMQGKPGSKVKLSIIREGVSEPIKLNLTREIIQVSATKSDIYDDIGYVRVKRFSDKTAQQVKQDVENLKKKNKNLSGLIIDLRNNPGGVLEGAVGLSDLFLDKGEIVTTQGREASSIVRYSAKQGDIIKNLPIVVLINAGSASASEIVAAALQDHKRAIVMGTKSFGKGSVQVVLPLPNKAAMKLTIALYYRPSGKKVQIEGVTPDIIVKPAEIKYGKENMYGSERELRNVAKDEKNKHIEKYVKKEEKDKDIKDYQIARAVELLKSLNLIKNKK